MQVVVEVGRQDRRTRRRAEADQAPLGERTNLRVVVGLGPFEPRIVLPRGLVRSRPAVVAGRAALPRRLGQRRHTTVRGVDQQRRALLAVDHREVRSGIEPEVVVTADVAVRSRRAVAAFRRRLAITVDRRVQAGAALRDLRLALFRLVVAEHEWRTGRPLERRQGAEIVGALQIGMAVGHAWNATGRGRFFRRRLSGDAGDQQRNREHGQDTFAHMCPRPTQS